MSRWTLQCRHSPMSFRRVENLTTITLVPTVLRVAGVRVAISTVFDLPVLGPTFRCSHYFADCFYAAHSCSLPLRRPTAVGSQSSV